MNDTLEFERTPLAPGSHLDNGMYRIERLLGAGGFALVYFARQGRWNLQVCIKEFYPFGCQRGPNGIYTNDPLYERRIAQGLQAFSDEAATLARFKHPGIVRVLGSFQENGTSYLVQEVLEGLTLSEGLGMAGRMPESMVMQVAQQVGQALLMVHAAGLVHSDLKPDNIFLTKEGRYVLLDFGLTRGFLSVDGAQIGGRGLSAGYSPPEQYVPGTTLTPATDVYGFAATLYSLLTGMPPPDALSRTRGQAVPAIKPVNPTITPKVEKALQQALLPDQSRRTPGVREFLHQLGLDSTPKAISYRPAPFQAKSSTLAHSKGVMTMALHAPSKRLYTGARNGILRVWIWPDMVPIAEFFPHDRHITALAVSQNGNYLVSGSEAGEVKLTPTDFSHPGVVLIQESAGVTSLSFHKDLVAASFVNGKCCLVGPTLPEPILWIAHAGPANRIEFHPDGSFVVSGGEDSAIRFWEIPQPKVFCELKGHEKGVTSVRFSADGTSLLSSSNDLSVKFWDLQANQIVRDLRGHNSVAFDARFTCLEHTVVSLAGDHTLRAFNLNSARLAFSSEARTERFRTLVVDPEQPLVATAAGDGHICLWELSERPTVTARPAEAAAKEPKEKPDLLDPLLGQRLGRYHITGILGEGGMATVYRATVGVSPTEVAVKVIRPDVTSNEFQQRFEREISVSMKLDHPNVLRTLDWGRQDKYTYLVMELVDGLPLKDYIPLTGLGLEQAHPYLKGVVEGLAYAHGLGIVHRDIKPENVMVTRTGQVMLMDFGLARDKTVKTVTRIGSAIGTAEYMAPEQVMRGPDRSGLTDKTDQYALGILIFEVLTGRRPFEWDDPVKLITMHVTQAPPALTSFRPDLPKAIDAVLARMLHKEVDDRYPSVRAAYDAFVAAAGL